MFDDTLDLAENKLLLLYIFRELDVPVTRNLITEIILENNFLNYFILQPYLSELISSNFLLEFESEDVHKLKITDKGLTALELFENRLSEDKKSLVDQYLSLIHISTPPVAFASSVIVLPKFCGELLSIVNDVIPSVGLFIINPLLADTIFPLSSFTSTYIV